MHLKKVQFQCEYKHASLLCMFWFSNPQSWICADVYAVFLSDTVSAVPLGLQRRGSGARGTKAPAHAEQSVRQQARHHPQQILSQVSPFRPVFQYAAYDYTLHHLFLCSNQWNQYYTLLIHFQASMVPLIFSQCLQCFRSC